MIEVGKKVLLLHVFSSTRMFEFVGFAFGAWLAYLSFLVVFLLVLFSL